MKHRVIAKLGGLRQHFSCFALRRFHRLEEAIGEEKDTLRRKLYESVAQFAKIINIYFRFVRVEWREAAPVSSTLQGRVSLAASGAGWMHRRSRAVWQSHHMGKAFG